MTDAFSKQQREAQRVAIHNHRLRIGLRAQAYLRTFWFNDETPDAEQAIQIEGWIDTLAPCTEDEIRDAWADYQRNGPRTARSVLIRPDPGAIWLIISKERNNRALVKQQKKRRDVDNSIAIPTEPKVSREEFDAFAKSMRVKTMGGKEADATA